MVAVGFFSIVRYIEDLDRREPLNVGVLVACGAEFEVRFVQREEIEDIGPARRFAGLVEHQVDRARDEFPQPFDGEAFLRGLALRRFSHFEISEPATLEVDADLGLLADGLATRLAAGHSPSLLQ